MQTNIYNKFIYGSQVDVVLAIIMYCSGCSNKSQNDQVWIFWPLGCVRYYGKEFSFKTIYVFQYFLEKRILKILSTT